MSNFRRRLMMPKKQNEYIKDGMVLWLDGIENSRVGHIYNPLGTWQDLSGNKYDFKALSSSTIVTPNENNMPFAEDGIYVNSSTDLQDLIQLVKNRTIEIVCTINDDDEIAKCIFSGGAPGKPQTAGQLWYRPASKALFVYSSGSYAYQVSDITNIHNYSVVYNNTSIWTTDVYQDNNKLISNSYNNFLANTTYNIIGGRNYNGTGNYRFDGKIYCIRIYDRQLSEEERAHNLKIDKERFGF